MIGAIVFSIVGIIAGGISAVLVAYIIHFFLQIPNIENAQSNISEFIGLMHAFVIIGIFEGFKRVNRQFFKNKRPVKIGIMGAIVVSILVSMTSIYATTETELYIAKKELVEKGKAESFEEASRGIENYVYRKTNNKGLPAYLEYSARKHPFFLFAVFVSCFISVWTTMPKGLRKIINCAGEIGLIEQDK
jgi:hypothetical protein